MEIENHHLATIMEGIRLPRWRSGKETNCQGRRCRFNPRVGKMPWRRAWQPTPLFLPRESHRQRSLVGYSPWGHKETDTTKATWHIHTHGGYLGKCCLGEKDPLYYLEVLRHHIHCLLLSSSEKKKKNHDCIQ